MTNYVPPIEDIEFLLNEVVNLDEICHLAGYEEISPDLVTSILIEAGRFASVILAPLNRIGDTEGSYLENNIVFADDKGTIYNIDNSGRIIWKKNIYKKIYKKIYKNLTYSLYDDKIFVSDNVGFIYAISLDNAQLIWIKNHGIPFRSKIKVFNNKIYLINQDNRILCFDAKDGKKKWDIRAVSSFIKSQNFLSLAISEIGDIIVLNSAGDMLKMNGINGRIYWSLNTLGSMYSSDTDFYTSSDVVISGNNIFFGSGSTFLSIDLRNGYVNWKIDLNLRSIPIIDGNNIFVVSNKGYFINIDKNTGKIIWSTNTFKILKEKKRNTRVTGIVMGSNKIYTTTLNGYLITSSAVSGKTEELKKIGDKITAPPIINNGSLYILTEESKILGFN